MYIYNLGLKFESVVKNYRTREALLFEDGYTITYDQLNRQANQFARYLLELGIHKNDVIAISGIKCLEIYVAVIACLKIGAIYTFLDPESPAERIVKILHIAAPAVFVHDLEQGKELIKSIEEFDILTINTNNRVEQRLNRFNDQNLPITKTITSENPAYLMFTSGSTGFPKGALMTHQNVLNFISWSTNAYQITPDDVLTNVNPMFFDNSVFDFYASIFSGASMVPLSKNIVTAPKTLVDIIDTLECTIWFSVPTLLIFLQTMRALSRNNFTHIKKIIFGGEGYPKSKLKQLFDLYGNRVELYNVYGPTECTCICSSYRITANDFNDLHGYPPLGQIIPNFSYLILDENNRKVPDNELGELCLLGPNVGKGYYGDPDRTTESFIQNPYNPQFKEIMYKTGDLVKYNPDNDMIYITGRADNQIKHMGYRIELEEIESALCQLNSISQAVALHGTVRGLSRIIAVVSIKEETNKEKIFSELRKTIPNYMIPSEIRFLDKLPTNQNGKIDRKILKEQHFSDN